MSSHQDLALQRNAARQPPDRLPDSVLRGMSSVFEAPSPGSAGPDLATVTVQTLDIPPGSASAVCARNAQSKRGLASTGIVRGLHWHQCTVYVQLKQVHVMFQGQFCCYRA